MKQAAIKPSGRVETMKYKKRRKWATVAVAGNEVARFSADGDAYVYAKDLTARPEIMANTVCLRPTVGYKTQVRKDS